MSMLYLQRYCNAMYNDYTCCRLPEDIIISIHTWSTNIFCDSFLIGPQPACAMNAMKHAKGLVTRSCDSEMNYHKQHSQCT